MRWQNKVRFECNDDPRGLIVYKTGTKAEEEKRKAEQREKEIMELKEAVGLSALLRKIAESVSYFSLKIYNLFYIIQVK